VAKFDVVQPTHICEALSFMGDPLQSGVELESDYELESPRVRVLAQSWSQSLSFQGDFDSRPYLFYQELCVI